MGSPEMSGEDRLQGYSGKVRRVLESAGVEIGDEVEVKAGERVYRGILMARYELADPDYIVLKLPNGYNIGVRAEGELKVRRVAAAKLSLIHI